MSHGTAAYITQEDVLIGSLTVLECLMFIARLRLPTALSAATKRGVVDNILSEMGLHSCKDAFIGTWPAKGISGKPLLSLLQSLPLWYLHGNLPRHAPSSDKLLATYAYKQQQDHTTVAPHLHNSNSLDKCRKLVLLILLNQALHACAFYD